MTADEPRATRPVHNYSPLELKPVGEWTKFYAQLRDEAPVVRNEFGRLGTGEPIVEFGCSSGINTCPWSGTSEREDEQPQRRTEDE